MKTALRLLLAPYRFSVDRLFRMGEVGWAHWFDAPGLYPGGNHLYLYQDSAGTTPVTAVGQSVGLVLDRAYGGMRGPELSPNAGGPFTSNTGFTHGSITASVDAGELVLTAIDGSSDRAEVSLSGLVVGKSYEFVAEAYAAPGVTNALFQSWTWATVPTTAITTGVWKTYRFIVQATATSGLCRVYPSVSTGAPGDVVRLRSFSIREIPGTHRIQATSASRPLLMARVNLLLNTATMSTQNVTTLAASYQLRFEGTGTVTLSGTATAGPLSAGTHSVTATAGTLTLTVSGSVTSADFRTADDASKNIPSYQRVGATAADHDTEGFPHAAYPDGTDDFDTTSKGGGGTSGFFFCGVLTVSGGAGTERTIWSDTGTNTGYRVRINASNKLELAAGNGSAYTTVESNETITAPGTYLLSAWDDGGVLAVQVGNAAAATTTRPTVSAGTSTITSYRDNGAATSYFNGRDYGSVYRQSYPGETAHNRLKQWQARRAGITV